MSETGVFLVDIEDDLTQRLQVAEAALAASQRQCEYMIDRMESWRGRCPDSSYDCPEGPTCHDCWERFLATRPWEEKP